MTPPTRSGRDLPGVCWAGNALSRYLRWAARGQVCGRAVPLPRATAPPLPAHAPDGSGRRLGRGGAAGQGSGLCLGGDTGKAKEKTSPESPVPGKDKRTTCRRRPLPHTPRQGFFGAPPSALCPAADRHHQAPWPPAQPALPALSSRSRRPRSWPLRGRVGPGWAVCVPSSPVVPHPRPS